jgi:hypothetical protein
MGGLAGFAGFGGAFGGEFGCDFGGDLGGAFAAPSVLGLPAGFARFSALAAGLASAAALGLAGFAGFGLGLASDFAGLVLKYASELPSAFADNTRSNTTLSSSRIRLPADFFSPLRSILLRLPQSPMPQLTVLSPHPAA